jgi:hypothetical protein
MDNEILGYVVCHTCKSPKAIKQGKGKRKAFVHGRCQCGPDTRTGVAMQAEMNAYKSLEEVEADIEALTAPKPEVTLVANQGESNPNQESQSETQSKPISTAKCVGAGAVLGIVFGGVFKVFKAVA